MSNMRITFLGTGAGQCIYRAHTAIVLDCPDNTRILLDAGSGNSVLQNGAKLGMLAQDFHQVLLTHQHGDHMGGLPHLQGQRTMADPAGPPLLVYSSEEALERVQRLFWATSITHSMDQDGVTTVDGRQVPVVRAWAHFVGVPVPTRTAEVVVEQPTATRGVLLLIEAAAVLFTLLTAIPSRRPR